jgi:hypothetical protein
MAEAAIRRDGDDVCFVSAAIGHWELVIGHSIQIGHDWFVNNLG